MRPVIRSYKKVLNFAPASHAAAAQVPFVFTNGVDGAAPDQTSATNATVPTGCVIKEITIEFSAVNLVAIASFLHLAVMRMHSGQTAPAPNAIGGNPLRNQVHLQLMKTLGQNQNRDVSITFKIPKKYQRVREGDQWSLEVTCDTIWTDACQVIYKLYT